MTFNVAVQTALPNGFMARHLYVSACSEDTFGICEIKIIFRVCMGINSQINKNE